MKLKLLIFQLCFLVALVGCARKTTSPDWANGTINWVINADTYGSSVDNFNNTPQNLSFVLNRFGENQELEQWTWAEIMYHPDSLTKWDGLVSIDVTYTSDNDLRVILCDSELEEFNPAAGFFAVLPAVQTDTTVSLVLDTEHFRQHDWVLYNFPTIRRTIDKSKITGIKIGTTAIDAKTNVLISRFVLTGVVVQEN
jgi:hypothetical protein